MADERRGGAAIGHLMLGSKKKGGGGGQLSPRGSHNACHRVLALIDGPANASQVVTIALGLGYWQTAAKNPTSAIVHGMNDHLWSAKERNGGEGKVKSGPNGIFTRDNGQFALRKGVRKPIQPTDPDRPVSLDTDVLILSVKAGGIPELKGVKLPKLANSPEKIAAYAGVTVDEVKAILAA